MSRGGAGRGTTWAYRRPERIGLLLSLGAVSACFVSCWLVRWAQAPVIRAGDFAPLAVYAGTLAAVHLAWVALGVRGDLSLPAIGLLLAGLGLAVQQRLGVLGADGTGVWRMWTLPAGAALMVAVAAASRGGGARRLEPLAIPCLLLAAGIVAVIVLAGGRFRGALFLPGRVNPAEFVKPLLAVFLAGFLAANREALSKTAAGLPAPPWRALGTLMVLWALPMALLVLQRDLGMVVLLNVTLVVLLFLATRRAGWLAAGLLLCVAGGAAMFRFAAHGGRRVAAWIDPFGDATGAGWQVLQSLSALYSGGWWGAGFGAGSPSSVPIAASDFVYAVLGEELGFVGCGLVLLLFALLAVRGYAAAGGAGDEFSRLLAAGAATLLAAQALWNVGGVIKAFPLTGIPLPFVSQGGSSLLTVFALLGLLVGISDGRGGGASSGRRRKRLNLGAVLLV